MDAAEILGAAPRAEFKVRTRPLEGDPKAKGLKGLNREVYALTGSTEVVEKTTTAPVFGKKRRLAHKQVQWEWLTFSSSARPDLDLKHWQKKGVQKEDYPFAKFNKHLTLVVYSDDEYAKLLENEGWTREKTDKLMKMVQRFDMNFVVIQDRWDGGEGGGGSVEILKDRFYSVQRVLTESRGTEEAAKDKEAETENILLTKPFNRQYEEDRKSAQEKAFTRSPDMDKAEQDILDKARKIEVTPEP
ncbi:hypothetical protein T484DRAFT_2938110 [Baffinella frigidus]|nr:hypothetical protein T484DRAFT_2938110 [Cryptophyta sp. CCMP2293]